MPEPITRVLLYRLGSLGDTVVALPSFHLIARAFPHAERRLLTNDPVSDKAPAAAAVLGESQGQSSLIHGYFPYPVGVRNPIRLFALALKLRLWRPQVLVYLAGARGVEVARRDAAFFRLCGIPRILGLPATEDLQQPRLLADGRTYEAEAARLARNLAELGDAQLDTPAAWDLHLTPAELAVATTRLAPLLETLPQETLPQTPTARRPLLAASLGTKRQCGDWEMPNWLELTRQLARRYPGHALVLLGAPAERAASQQLAESWTAAGGSAVLNLAGELTPRESGAVLAHARVYIGHDSGPMHLAAAVQTSCVAIFSARQKPGMWFPYGPHHHVLYHQVSCWGCNLETCIVEQKRCILSITVDEVLAATEAALAEDSLPLKLSS